MSPEFPHNRCSIVVVVGAHGVSEGFLFPLVALIREQLKLGAP